MARPKLTLKALAGAVKSGNYLDTIGQEVSPTIKLKRTKTEVKPRGRPKSRPVNPDEPTKAQNCRPGESRVTYIVTDETQEKVKRLSYHKGASVKEVVNRALSEFISKYEKAMGGPLKPIPNDKLKL